MLCATVAAQDLQAVCVLWQNNVVSRCMQCATHKKDLQERERERERKKRAAYKIHLSQLFNYFAVFMALSLFFNRTLQTATAVSTA